MDYACLYFCFIIKILFKIFNALRRCKNICNLYFCRCISTSFNKFTKETKLHRTVREYIFREHNLKFIFANFVLLISI